MREEEKNELLNLAKEKKLDSWQIFEVKLGLDILPAEMIKKYMDADYDYLQMEQIRIALVDGIPENELEALKPDMDWREMQQFRINKMKGEHSEDILVSIKALEEQFARMQTKAEKQEAENCQLKEKIQKQDTVIRKKDTALAEQKQELEDLRKSLKEKEDIIGGLEAVIKSREADLEVCQKKLEEMRKEKVVHHEQFSETNKQPREKKILQFFRFSKKREFSIIKIIESSRFTPEQIEEIRLSLEDNLSENQLQKIAVESNSFERMKQLRLFYKTMNDRYKEMDSDRVQEKQSEHMSDAISLEEEKGELLFDMEEGMFPEEAFLTDWEEAENE
ncbi:MAG: hypothetical protein NC089_02950 [Bacteroides sp.]|nr:hypothetical protein [Bacteroides sp.]MCM1550519.1 hypothetical protein [Clostridium sp.]